MKLSTWECPKPEDLSPVEFEAVRAWLHAHGLDPKDYIAAAVRGDELHLTEKVRDENDQPIVDYALGQVVTRPKVVPLVSDPPTLSKRGPEYAVSAEDTRRYGQRIRDVHICGQ